MTDFHDFKNDEMNNALHDFHFIVFEIVKTDLISLDNTNFPYSNTHRSLARDLGMYTPRIHHAKNIT